MVQAVGHSINKRLLFCLKDRKYLFQNTDILYQFFLIGEGAFASVYKVKRLSDSQEYALKKVGNQNEFSKVTHQKSCENLSYKLLKI